jgi:hypothetical protein
MSKTSARLNSRVIIGIACLFILSCLPTSPSGTEQSPQAETEYVGRIIDSNNQQPIAGAEVSLDLAGVPPVVYTDSQGVYKFNVSISAAISGQIRVNAPGYQVYTRNVTIFPEIKTIEDIRLTALPANTIILTPTMTYMIPPPPFEYFDDFDTDGPLDGRWNVADDPAACTNKVKSGGFLNIECHSITTDKTEYSIFPYDPAYRVVQGVAIRAKVANPISDKWGKLHLKISFKNDSNGDVLTYFVSLRGGRVSISEDYNGVIDEDTTKLTPILPDEFHLVTISYETENLSFSVDGSPIEFKHGLTPEFHWETWVLEAYIDKQTDESKVLKAMVDWVAIKK